MGKFLALWALLAVPSAWAHAVLLEGTPQQGAVVSGPEIPVSLRFNSRIDGHRSQLLLLTADGKQQALALLPQPAPDRIAARISVVKAGLCRIRWQVLASDGHITRGELAFQVR